MRYTESPEAKAEREYNEKVKQIIEGGGCWLTHCGYEKRVEDGF